MLSEILNCKRLDLYLKFDQPLKSNEVDKYREWIFRRGKFEPLQYITGKVEFYGITFRVTPDVLIPRPETEILVETILNDYKNNGAVKVLDIGVGSGCIAISLAKNLAGCEVLGIDISEDAIRIAGENSNACEAVDKLKLIAGDIRHQSFQEQFDLIVSNPPYVSKNEFETLQKEIKEYEPSIAVTDQNDGLDFYRIISTRLDSLLKPAGKIYFEIGKDQASEVADILRENGISKIIVIKDLQGIERIITGEKE